MAQVQQETRRRIRTRSVTGKAKMASGTVKRKLDELTKSIRDAEAAAAALSKKAGEARDEALKTMQTAKMDVHNSAYGELKVKVSPGRCATSIDPAVFHNAVGNDEAFYESVKVQMGKAKENLSGKEFDSIATVTEGKPGKPALQAEFYWPPEESE